MNFRNMMPRKDSAGKNGENEGKEKKTPHQSVLALICRGTARPVDEFLGEKKKRCGFGRFEWKPRIRARNADGPSSSKDGKGLPQKQLKNSMLWGSHGYSQQSSGREIRSARQVKKKKTKRKEKGKGRCNRVRETESTKFELHLYQVSWIRESVLNWRVRTAKEINIDSFLLARLLCYSMG